jgi:ribosomal protein S5
VVVGDSNGHVGLGVKCAKEVATAIRGAIILAKTCAPRSAYAPALAQLAGRLVPPAWQTAATRASPTEVSVLLRQAVDHPHFMSACMPCRSVVPVRRGYWGNKIGKPHTVPTKTTGKCGSVTVRL